MTVEFQEWCAAASVSDRREAVGLLADALFSPGAQPGEIESCLAALLFLAADPSPKVRGAIADRLAAERAPPRRLVRLLCQDVDSIAVPLAAATRALLEADLVELVATGSPRMRCALARRAVVSAPLAEALAEIGERVVALELLANLGAEIAPATLRRLARRFAADACVRELLLRRATLPADIRQTLVVGTREILVEMDLVRGVLGESAARRVASEACEEGAWIIAEGLDMAAMDEFLAHLRQSGEVTTGFLARAACAGRIEFFAAALSSLSGLGFARVRAILVDAREPAFSALCAAAKLPHDVRPLLLSAVRLWRDHAKAGRDVDAHARVAILERLEMLVREGVVPAAGPLSELVSRLAAQEGRNAARRPSSWPRLAA